MFNETGHSLICGFPYRDCVAACRAADKDWRGGKFSSELAFRLWTLTLESGQDDEYGNAETVGWFGRFNHERAILSADAQGFVGVAVLATADDLDRVWSDIGHVDYPHESGAMLGECAGCDYDHEDCGDCEYCLGPRGTR